MNEHGGSLTGKAMNSVLRNLCVVVCATVLSSVWCHGEEMKPPKVPSLLEIIFIGLKPAKELNPAHYPKERQLCLQNYLAAIAPDSYLWAFEPPSTSEKVLLVKRRNLIEQMVTILGHDVRSEAEAFANAVPLMAEW